ncbi:hypothetical protein [Streptomyces geranii]|uniref:hypothetical protein n=1 Tax=Streptomyces geranii TaxID=2058923 RepID=UPI001E316551|nr:hypothetical protein [Streptomyces geranii]
MKSTTVSWPLVQRSAGALAVCAALATTSGCGVPVDAVAGISVDAEGRLLGVIMVCGHHIDGASLYIPRDEPDKNVTVGHWTAEHPLKPGLTTWPLNTPAAGWTATKYPNSLTARTTYTLYGWTKDNSWSASSISFTTADRDRLTPDMVRYQDYESTVTVPVAEFKTKACEES